MTFTLLWEGISIAVSHRTAVFGGPYDHIELRASGPLPVTTTGYRSLFIHPDTLAHFGGPEEFVRQWLDEAAEREAWRAARRKGQQLSLF